MQPVNIFTFPVLGPWADWTFPNMESLLCLSTRRRQGAGRGSSWKESRLQIKKDVVRIQCQADIRLMLKAHTSCADVCLTHNMKTGWETWPHSLLWESFWGFTALLPKPAFHSPLFFSFLFVSARTHACSAALVAPDSAVPWAVAHQAPLSTGFSRQEHRSGLPWPPPGNLPDSGIRLTSLAFPTSAGGLFSTGAAGEVPSYQPKMTRSTICSMPGALNVCSFNTPQNCTKHALFSLYHK